MTPGVCYHGGHANLGRAFPVFPVHRASAPPRFAHMYAACPFRGLTPVPCYGRTIKLPKREATRMIDVTTEALLVALLAPPAVFGAAVALESWRSHRAEVRQATAAARDRHPAGRGLGLCPDCEGLVFDAATHGRYCPGRRPS